MYIPKIFHQVWLGNDAPPKEFLSYQEKWLQLNPAWKLKIWNYSNIGELININMSDLELCKNFAEKTDYLRFCILLELGGVYIDMDFEPLKPIDDLIAVCKFFIGEKPEGGVEIAILGATPRHNQTYQIFKKLHQRLLATKENAKKINSVNRIGPNYITGFFKEKTIGKLYEDGSIIFEKKYFYPAEGKNFYKGYLLNKKIDLSDSFAIHHYYGHWCPNFYSIKILIYNIPYFGIALYRVLKYFHIL